MRKDRCYLIPSKNGLGFIRVRAAKKPAGKTLVALQELFDAAERKYRAEQKRPKR